MSNSATASTTRVCAVIRPGNSADFRDDRSYAHRSSQRMRKKSTMLKSAISTPTQFGLMVCALLLLHGCGNSRKTYVLTGRIISKQPSSQELIIHNDDIPGFMPAMTMPYAVKDPEGFERVQPADLIRADVVVEQPTQFYLEHLAVIGKSAASTSPQGAPVRALLIGDKAPDVPLVNQDGKTLRLSQLKGKAVLLTFVYTRCPFPDYCPLLSRQFAAIQNDLAKTPDDYNRTHLVSISLDPNYDKPPILRQYGLSYVEHDPKGFQHWDFVSTKPQDLQILVGSFGLEYSDEDSQISHSMNTILLAPDGTMANMWPGNEWKPSEVADVIRHALTAGK
jgi:protein SCO1